MSGMDTLDVTKSVDHLFLRIRQEPLGRQTELVNAAREALEHELADSLRRICYRRKEAGDRTADIAESIGRNLTTVNRMIREYAATYHLKPLMKGPAPGDEILRLTHRP